MGLFSKVMGVLQKTGDTLPGGPIHAKKNDVLCDRFSVKGKNPATGRRKTVSVVVERGACDEEIQGKSGLLPPYEISPGDPAAPPSEAQIRYAEKLGFAFPRDASSDDAHIFLTRAENGEPLVQPAMPDELVRYLIGKGIFVPAYAGASDVDRIYMNGVQPLEKYAFFCMRTYADLTDAKWSRLEDAPADKRDRFYKFAGSAADDTEFIRSFLHYGAEELSLLSRKRMKKLRAYEIAREFLRSEGLI